MAYITIYKLVFYNNYYRLTLSDLNCGAGFIIEKTFFISITVRFKNEESGGTNREEKEINYGKY